MRSKLTALLLVVILPVMALAGTVGKVVGQVVDADGRTIAGANVYLEGTTYGASSDVDGNYTIVNVPAGKYTLVCSVLGYKKVNVANLAVIPDFVTPRDFNMTTTTIAGESITVVATRPLIQLDKTSSVLITPSEEIRELPISGYKELVTIQPGVTEFTYCIDTRVRYYNESSNGPRFMVRGGRPEEVQFNVDGITLNDPYSGFVTINVPELAWNDFLLHKGNFSAEYGRYMSGVVNYATKTGATDYTFEMELSTDNVSGDALRHDQNLYSVAFGGPVLPDSPNYRFFVAADKGWSRDRNPSIKWDGMNPNSTDDYYSYFAKVTAQLTDAMRLDVGTIGSRDDWLEYRHSYYFDPAHLPRYLDKNQVYYGRLNHSLSADLYYILAVNYNKVSRLRGGRSNFGDSAEDYLAYGRTVLPGSSGLDETTLFRQPGDPDDPLHLQNSWRNFMKRESESYGLRFDINKRYLENHDLKAGFETQMYTLRHYENYFAYNMYHLDPVLDPDTTLTPELRANRAYREANFFGWDETSLNETSGGLNGAKQPLVLGAYFADKFNWSDVIIDVGMRWDYLDPATKRLKSEERPLDPDYDPNDPTYVPDDDFQEDTDLEEATAHSIVSPRLGVSFPVSDVTTFHFNYGHYTQFPPLYTMYVNYNYMAHMIEDGGYHVVFGNPNLKPEKTIAYEFGFSHALNEYSVLDVTAFYKNVNDLINAVSIESFPTSFSTYRNMDHAVIKGIEFEVAMREYRNIAARVNYTLSWANGTGSGADGNDRIAHTNADPPTMTAPLDFDMRHSLKGAVTYTFRDNEGPQMLGMRMLANTAFGATFTANSGQPFTKKYVYNEISLGQTFPTPERPVNSTWGPWIYNVDLHVARNVYLYGVSCQFYVDIRNLFDTENELSVWESSGTAETTYWLDSDGGQNWVEDREGEAFLGGYSAEEIYRLKEENPNNYGNPRMIMAGVNISL
ncbi:TonB-dependent receptor [bacterium]|nr:TonB-dependent receptor [bacterium]